MKVTVAICTWNRSNLLDQTLTQMHKLCIPEGVDWELLVVNNKCTDDTDAVIARHTDALPLRRLFEPKQGLSNARNCVIDHSQGDLLLWTDDDVLVDPSWLAEYARAAALYPQAAYFGGPVEPWFACPPPHWVRDNLEWLASVYAIRTLGDSMRLLERHEFPVGASMAIRLAAQREYRYDPTLGRSSISLRGGEEIAVLRQLQQRYGTGVWVGTARVRHYIPAVRITSRFVWEWFRWEARVTWQKAELPAVAELFGRPRYALRSYATWLLRYWLLSLTKRRAWFQALVQSANVRGLLDEYVARRTLDSLPQKVAVHDVPL